MTVPLEASHIPAYEHLLSSSCKAHLVAQRMAFYSADGVLRMNRWTR